MKNRLRLVLPSKKYLASFAAGIRESRKENPRPMRSEFALFHTAKDFPAYNKRRIEERKGINIAKGKVPQTVYWAIVGEKFAGVLKLRHRLWKDRLASHIGYAVIPSERKKGYATEMLRQGIKKARLLGIKKIIIQCNQSNVASKRVIEKNKGVFFEKVKQEGDFKLRFYIK